MGLDMYGMRAPRTVFKNPDAAFGLEPIDTPEGEQPARGQQIAYWRKFNHLHGWMERLYEARGGTKTFNCVPLRLTPEDIDMLEAELNKLEAKEDNDLTPTEGFFFGGPDVYPEDISDTRAFIAKAREAFLANDVVLYDSWW